MPGPSSWKPEQNFSSHNEISRPVQRHLVNVYLVLAGMLGLAAFGSTLNVGAASGGMLETGVVLGSVFGIRHLNPENRLRWLLLGVIHFSLRSSCILLLTHSVNILDIRIVQRYVFVNAHYGLPVLGSFRQSFIFCSGCLHVYLPRILSKRHVSQQKEPIICWRFGGKSGRNTTLDIVGERTLYSIVVHVFGRAIPRINSL